MPKAVTRALDARDGSLSAATMALGAIGFAVALAIAAQVRIPLPFTPVPITLQTFVLYLGGAWLGLRVGIPGLALYVGAALLGAPVMSGMRGGMAAFTGATGGYILGWFVAVLIVSRLLDGRATTMRRAALSMAAGSAVILTCGALHLALLLELDFAQAFLLGVAPFIPGDVLKILTASAIVGRWPNPTSIR
jgi:biotin transport system substrate-specific component